MKFTLCLAQIHYPDDEDVVSLVANCCDDARHMNADIIAFPEYLMTPYRIPEDEFISRAQPLDGSFSTAIDSIAREMGLWVAYTMNESNPSGLPHNTAVITDDTGRKRAVYRKTHPFDAGKCHESDRMEPGSELMRPLDTPFGRLGMAICYDLRFPEIARKSAIEGCDLMLHPAGWVSGDHKESQWLTLLAARAIENGMYVAGVCLSGHGYIGTSCMFDPDGEPVVKAGTDDELVFCEIDTERVVEARRRTPVLEHRRPSLY